MPKHAGVVMEPDGDPEGALPGKLAGAVQQVAADLLRLPGGPHDVVDADDQGGEDGPVVERLASCLRRTSATVAWDGELVEGTWWSTAMASVGMRPTRATRRTSGRRRRRTRTRRAGL